MKTNFGVCYYFEIPKKFLETFPTMTQTMTQNSVTFMAQQFGFHESKLSHTHDSKTRIFTSIHD
jgi:hypothetical protein